MWLCSTSCTSRRFSKISRFRTLTFYRIRRHTVCRWQNLCLVCLVPFFPIYLLLRVEYLCCNACAPHINTPAPGLAKGQATAAHLPSPFSVCFDDRRLPACCAATVFLNSCFRASSSTSSPHCFDVSHLTSAISVSFHHRLRRLLPSSPSPSPPSLPYFRHYLLHQCHQHLPCFCHCSSTPSLIFAITIIFCHHLVSPTPQDTSWHQCQYTDIYASPIFIICAFSLVGDMASGPILSLSSPGTFLNSHVDADSTLQYLSHTVSALQINTQRLASPQPRQLWPLPPPLVILCPSALSQPIDNKPHLLCHHLPFRSRFSLVLFGFLSS